MEQPCSSLVLLLSWGEQVVPSQLLCCSSGLSCLISDASVASPVQWLLLWFCVWAESCESVETMRNGSRVCAWNWTGNDRTTFALQLSSHGDMLFLERQCKLVVQQCVQINRPLTPRAVCGGKILCAPPIAAQFVHGAVGLCKTAFIGPFSLSFPLFGPFNFIGPRSLSRAVAWWLAVLSRPALEMTLPNRFNFSSSLHLVVFLPFLCSVVWFVSVWTLRRESVLRSLPVLSERLFTEPGLRSRN